MSKIRTDLLRAEVIAEYRKRLLRVLRMPDPAYGRRETLEREIQNIVGAIGQGLLSPRLSARLKAAETELASLPDTGRVIETKDVLSSIGPAIKGYRRRVAELSETMRIAPDIARKVIQDGVGQIVVTPKQDSDGKPYWVAK